MLVQQEWPTIRSRLVRQSDLVRGLHGDRTPPVAAVDRAWPEQADVVRSDTLAQRPEVVNPNPRPRRRCARSNLRRVRALVGARQPRRGAVWDRAALARGALAVHTGCPDLAESWYGMSTTLCPTGDDKRGRMLAEPTRPRET